MSINITGREQDEARDILKVDDEEQEREEEENNDLELQGEAGYEKEGHIFGEKDNNEEQIGQLEATADEDVTDDTSRDDSSQDTEEGSVSSLQIGGKNREERETEVKRSSGEKQMFILYSSILLVVCINCFFNSLQCGFVFDDHKAIITNLDLRPTTPLTDIFKNDFWGTPLSSDRSHKSYRPLTILTFRLNYLIGELEPGGYHLFNLIFHWILCVLMMHISKMFFSDWLAFILSMMFAVHPIHTDAVSGVVGRAESLSAILALLTLKSYTYAGGYRRAETDWNYIWITITLTVMATLCKEQGITIVAVCCVYEVFWSQKICLWEALDLFMLAMKTPQKIPQWLVDAIFRMLAIVSSAVILVALRVILMGAHLPHFVRYDNPIAFESAPVKQLSLCYLFPRNFWLLVYPHYLLCDYSGSTIPMVKHFSDPRNLATLNFLGGLGALTYLALTGTNKLARQIAMALAFLVFPFLPASNIFFPVGFVLAERILYFPSIGFSMLVVIGLQQLLKYRQFHSWIYVLLAATLVLHGARTARRNEDWKSKDSLFRAGLHVTTDNSKLWLNLGHFHEIAKEYHKALACYNASFQSEYAIENGALTEIGRVYHSMGDDAKAEYYLTQAQRHMAPPGPKERYSHKYVQTFYYLADIRMKDKVNWPEAENLLKKAIRLNQEYEEAYKKLSDLYMKMDEFHKATGILRRYLATDSRNCNILVALANLYRSGRKPEEALNYYKECLVHSPNHEMAQYNMAVILEMQMGDEGREQLIDKYKHLVETSGQNKGAHLIKLGELYRKAEDYENALSVYMKALELLPDDKTVLSALGVIYKLMNDTDAASSYLHRTVKMHPNDAQVWQRLGEFYVEIFKKLQNGLQYFQKCLSLDPNNIDCDYNICVVLVRAKQYKDAEKCFNALAEKNPSVAIEKNLQKVLDYLAEKIMEQDTPNNV